MIDLGVQCRQSKFSTINLNARQVDFHHNWLQSTGKPEVAQCDY